jgi:hypothetical protein
MRRVISGVLAALFSVVGLVGGLAPSASAAGGFDLTLTRISPQWLAVATDVRLTLNIEASQAFSDSVVFKVRQTTAPLEGRADIATVMSGKADLASQVVGEFDTGMGLLEGSNSISLTLAESQLDFSRNGVYMLHVTATAGSTKSSIDILLPYFNNQEISDFKPLRVLPLWTVATPPSVNVRGQYLSQDAVNAFGDNGTAGAIVKAAAGRADLTWLIDPDTVRTAQRIAGGGEILGDSIEVVSNDQSTAASRWLESLRVSTYESDIYALPYANAEINALINNDLNALAFSSVSQTQYITDALERLPIARAAIAHRGDFSYNTWRWLAQQNLSLTILSDSKYSSASSSYTSSGIAVTSNGRKSLVVDSQASRQCSGAITSNARAALRRQALISDLLITMLERPNESRLLVLRPDTTRSDVSYIETADTLDSLSVPWIEASTVADAFAADSTSERINSNTRIGAGIRKTAIKDIKWVQRRREALSGLIGGTEVDAALRDAQLRLASATFTGTEVRAMRLATIADLQNVIGSVEIMSSGAVLFPREESVVPITIRNDLPVAVTIRLVAIGEPAVRVTPGDVGLITIQPGKRKSIEIPTKLAGSDIAFLSLRLADKDGQEFGPRTRIQLSSSAYAQAASYVVGAAAVLLVLMIVINAVRRVRSRGDKSATTIGTDV